MFTLDAVRRGDGRKVDDRRIIVDRELGRTKKSWYPRRLGGGKGEARRDRLDEEMIRELQKQISDTKKEKQAQSEPKVRENAEEGVEGNSNALPQTQKIDTSVANTSSHREAREGADSYGTK